MSGKGKRKMSDELDQSAASDGPPEGGVKDVKPKKTKTTSTVKRALHFPETRVRKMMRMANSSERCFKREMSFLICRAAEMFLAKLTRDVIDTCHAVPKDINIIRLHHLILTSRSWERYTFLEELFLSPTQLHE
ncbi:unnamed protein product [Vitrella brassicaformis CCMP3155]|uniref:Uncharacterized protein n=1 Tax=Vitrella brassicaformis (strain CCMP3155) TaxID=1169540 RepID=A0A0G4EL25_VITBC|nr:unnamed protein product [Vitrella brassicaformis CCMP3155]|eukprot:CEL97694.1 unnamed protein product [Vitrella brassicaformis CCMP3155]